MIDVEHYIGNELELFDKAANWKRYYGNMIKPYLNGVVMEAGAGIGSTTQSLCNGSQQQWICMEPDRQLANKIEEKIKQSLLPSCCSLRVGILKDQPADERYNAIIYIDVIEHIEDDFVELKEAASRLKPGGYLAILVPAHQWLFSPFDKSIGHFRRYSKARLAQAVPPSLNKITLRYLDTVGLAASAANKLLLKQSYPTAQQINLWDSAMVPVSTVVDRIIGYSIGKSVLGIWQKK
jgi:2-polyprenyl-3-methyl-5-hydroxy-6-metoxy-1,4-benzoquinol methylase